MKNLPLPSARLVRAYVRATRQRVQLGRGRTDRIGWAHDNVPVNVTPDGSDPRLVGAPYWKTAIRNGSFCRTLYTGSTLRIEVGEDWIRRHAAPDSVRDEVYSDDTH